MRSPTIRRSPFLVSYWERSRHCVYNYLTRTQRNCTPVELTILEAASSWAAQDSLKREVGAGLAEFDEIIEQLIESTLLERLDQPPPPAASALEEWYTWNPVAGFFHAKTKSPDLDLPHESAERPVLSLRSYPPPLKDYSDRPRLDLPKYAIPGEFTDVLHARRTWREFGERKLGLQEIAALLGATFGVQSWLEVQSDRWVALKTSPSGGARHGAEAYLIAFSVDGLEPGIYHYGPDTHSLARLAGLISHAEMPKYLPRQEGFHDPAALVVMTTIFARLQWKYSHPHAYRVALLDAGHLGQTFALVATALGLAPFCTAAIDSEAFERLLGVDGVSESALLALGVGARPATKEWAPLHDRTADVPVTVPPASAARFESGPIRS